MLTVLTDSKPNQTDLQSDTHPLFAFVPFWLWTRLVALTLTAALLLWEKAQWDPQVLCCSSCTSSSHWAVVTAVRDATWWITESGCNESEAWWFADCTWTEWELKGHDACFNDAWSNLNRQVNRSLALCSRHLKPEHFGFSIKPLRWSINFCV